MRPPPRPGWTAWLALFLMTVGAMILTVWVNASSDRKWCSVVTTLDNAWAESPPTTPAGRNLARDFHELRGQLGCPRR